MRLPAWLALTASVCLLLAVGALGVQMNRAALRTAEHVHRTDARALAANNRALISQYVRQAAQDLTQVLVMRPAALQPGDPGDAASLTELVNRSAFFRFGAALTDLAGKVYTQAIGVLALPTPDDAAFQSLYADVRFGETGVSGVLRGQSTPLVAIGVPVTISGDVRGALLGFADLRDSLLQGFIVQLSGESKRVGIVDSLGNVVVDSDLRNIAKPVDRNIAEAAWDATGTPSIVEYSDGDRRMVAAIVGGLPGGWGFYQAQPVSEFYGPVRDRRTELNLVLLVLVVVAALSLTFVSHRAAAADRRAEKRFAALVKNSTDLISVVNRDGLIVYDSPSVAAFLGYAPGARIGKPLLLCIHPDDRSAVSARLERIPLRNGAIGRLDCRLRRGDHSFVWVDLCVSNLLHDPAIRGIVVNGRDVSDHRRMQEQLSYQAQHDPLTGLPNRQVFSERLQLAASRAGRRMIAVLFIDLDRFKWVNDEWGHDVGDELLRRVARRLSSCLRANDTLARVGGDEFVALLDGIRDEAEAAGIAGRIVEAISEPFTMPDNAAIRIGASVGISISLAGSAMVDAEDMVRTADAAMYRAKQAGGVGYRVAPASAAA